MKIARSWLAWFLLVFVIFSIIDMYPVGGRLPMRPPSPAYWIVDLRDFLFPRNILDSAYAGLWLPIMAFYTVLLMFWWRFKTWWD